MQMIRAHIYSLNPQALALLSQVAHKQIAKSNVDIFFIYSVPYPGKVIGLVAPK